MNAILEVKRKSDGVLFYRLDVYTFVLVQMITRGSHLPMDQYDIFVDGKQQLPPSEVEFD
jgi:hypothetical protein